MRRGVRSGAGASTEARAGGWGKGAATQTTQQLMAFSGLSGEGAGAWWEDMEWQGAGSAEAGAGAASAPIHSTARAPSSIDRVRRIAIDP